MLQTKENQNTGSFVIVDTGGNIVKTGKEQEVSASTPPGSPSESLSNSSEIGDHSSAISQSSSEPTHFRLLGEIYNETEEIELEDDMLLLSVEEPANFSEAVKEKEWKAAMKQEIDSIEENKTWQLTELPAGHKAIGLKWVFKLKKDTNGDIIKHKVCLVAKGYVQKQGIDYEEVYALVT